MTPLRLQGEGEGNRETLYSYGEKGKGIGRPCDPSTATGRRGREWGDHVTPLQLQGEGEGNRETM